MHERVCTEKEQYALLPCRVKQCMEYTIYRVFSSSGFGSCKSRNNKQADLRVYIRHSLELHGGAVSRLFYLLYIVDLGFSARNGCFDLRRAVIGQADSRA